MGHGRYQNVAFLYIMEDNLLKLTAHVSWLCTRLESLELFIVFDHQKFAFLLDRFWVAQ